MLILIKLRWLLYFLYREIKYSCGRCKKLNCICICRHWHTRKSYLVYSLHESFRVPYNILSKLDFKTVKFNFLVLTLEYIKNDAFVCSCGLFLYIISLIFVNSILLSASDLSSLSVASHLPCDWLHTEYYKASAPLDRHHIPFLYGIIITGRYVVQIERLRLEPSSIAKI